MRLSRFFACAFAFMVINAPFCALASIEGVAIENRVEVVGALASSEGISTASLSLSPVAVALASALVGVCVGSLVVVMGNKKNKKKFLGRAAAPGSKSRRKRARGAVSARENTSTGSRAMYESPPPKAPHAIDKSPAAKRRASIHVVRFAPDEAAARNRAFTACNRRLATRASSSPSSSSSSSSATSASSKARVTEYGRTQIRSDIGAIEASSGVVAELEKKYIAVIHVLMRMLSGDEYDGRSAPTLSNETLDEVGGEFGYTGRTLRRMVDRLLTDGSLRRKAGSGRPESVFHDVNRSLHECFDVYVRSI